MTSFMDSGGHLENMQIRSIRSNFSAWQHWLLDLAYPNYFYSDPKPFSSQNACTFIIRWFFLFFVLNKSKTLSTWTPVSDFAIPCQLRGMFSKSTTGNTLVSVFNQCFVLDFLYKIDLISAHLISLHRK